MKKLLNIVANKMQPSLVKCIIQRLASDSPSFFIQIQNYSKVIIAVLGSIIGAMTTHQIPDFKYENIVIYTLGLLTAIVVGIGGGTALATKDASLVSKDVKESVISDVTKNN